MILPALPNPTRPNATHRRAGLPILLALLFVMPLTAGLACGGSGTPDGEDAGNPNGGGDETVANGDDDERLAPEDGESSGEMRERRTQAQALLDALAAADTVEAEREAVGEIVAWVEAQRGDGHSVMVRVETDGNVPIDWERVAAWEDAEADDRRLPETVLVNMPSFPPVTPWARVQVEAHGNLAALAPLMPAAE